MSRVQSAVGEFARRGFESASAAAKVWQRWLDALDGATPPVPLDALEPAASRDQALESLARMWESAPETVERLAADEGWLRRVVLVLGASSALARFLVRHPSETELLRVPGGHRNEEQWREFFEGRCHVDGVVAAGDADALRRANYAALCEIAARDLSAPEPAAVVHKVSRELSAVADAVLDVALAHARAEVPGWEKVHLAILAMGKTGAQELNYVSDVDVIHVAEPAEGVGADEAMAVGARLAAAVARICSAHTGEGTIWPVDAALRPEGKAGPLVRTLDSCRIYYQKWAKNWEFQALIKARPAAGDKELGQRFCDMVAPLVWQAGEREGFLAEVRAMRQRVISLIPPKHADREIKLGAGGLRDTEFSVQLLQLVHGRADERIRGRGTYEALRSLVATGYIGRADGLELEDSYRFQRVLEHRVQLRQLRRSHLVPDDEAALKQLARGLGITAEELTGAWRASVRSVQRLQQRIFYSPLLDAVSSISAETLKLSDNAAQTRMRALGFLDPRSALGHIKALTTGSSRSVEIQRQLLPAMLDWFAEGPNPDFGLLAFRQLSEALGSTSWYLRALRDEGWMAQRLARIASSSRYVVDLLKRAPETVQMLADREELRPRTASELSSAMTRAAARHDDRDRAIASVRALRRSELCRIALSDVLGDVDLDTVGLGLSNLAAASMDAALAIAARDTDAPPVGVIALGRWGGREMSYSSDIDVMFVVDDGSDADAIDAATQVVRTASDILGRPGPDPALAVDSDLRPEGKDGPQVRTVSSYLSYYEKWSATWEAQAMVRARAGAGDRELAARVVDGIESLRYPEGGLSRAQLFEIRKLKSRMEAERIPRGVPRERHLKLGQGGLSDVEWTVQLLQLQHGHELEALRTTSTMQALAGLQAEKVLTQRQAADLRAAWQHASRLRNAIMLARGRASDSLPADYRELATIATLMGDHSGQTSHLLEETRRLMRRASQVVDKLFWES
ncbi:bifunctional [glutamine synthetase] adenylyltransferase/[glutamine synthetase]-adenylyl-L-tyrosine phosphorylase [Tessaracoccus sp. OS52]|uniref:bifunctional [glutamine synthetase] adenylyltransferase/[glutamine synthetase]-adenylyl-L-tyrosine phosphorylase n=1 Tax=Tessaracoccus sp. OS52 TaxID=2886691 RepID=UPI001D12AF7E|nr:bifunctional [glutamine synthetase] adenylyltransferase/[glutamine synthetase]-adenylyl-L-tyrosine phosphorylase [Tessaracoccus sp. OS52]